MKAQSPMLVMPLPMVMEVKPVHSAKAVSPMLVTRLPMVMEVRLVQPPRAELAMPTTFIVLPRYFNWEIMFAAPFKKA